MEICMPAYMERACGPTGPPACRLSFIGVHTDAYLSMQPGICRPVVITPASLITLLQIGAKGSMPQIWRMCSLGYKRLSIYAFIIRLQDSSDIDDEAIHVNHLLGS